MDNPGKVRLLMDFLKRGNSDFFKYSNPDILLEINGEFRAFGPRAVHEILNSSIGGLIPSQLEYQSEPIVNGFYEVKFNSDKCVFKGIQIEIKNSKYFYFNLKIKE